MNKIKIFEVKRVTTEVFYDLSTGCDALLVRIELTNKQIYYCEEFNIDETMTYLIGEFDMK